MNKDWQRWIQMFGIKIIRKRWIDTGDGNDDDDGDGDDDDDDGDNDDGDNGDNHEDDDGEVKVDFATMLLVFVRKPPQSNHSVTHHSYPEYRFQNSKHKLHCPI